MNFNRMDKIKINNQVVIMRKFVKQAKVHIINKWVKESKLLQARKGNEDQVLKCKRKAERLLLGISLLQKMKIDNVSKIALSKSKDWKAILRQKNTPMEERCLAVLANFGPLQAEVEKFHSENNYLVPKIPTLLQEWEEKAKLNSQSPQKNKKAFQKSNKAFEKSGNKGEINLNQSKISQSEEKPKIGSTQLKSLPNLIAPKPLKKEESEQSDMDNNASDSSSEDVDESVEENAKFLGKNNFNNINSQKLLKISKNANDAIASDSNPFEIDSSADEDEGENEDEDESVTPKSEDESVTQESEDEDESVTQESENKDESVTQESENEDESVTQESEDEDDCSNISQKGFDPVNQVVTSKESELMRKSVRRNPKPPKKFPTKTNKNTKKQPIFQKSYSPEPNSTKAVALINLNEMLDMDEIPIDNSRTAVETIEETGKRKRDTFFLSGDGEDFSEGDNEDSDDNKRKGNRPPFRKKQRDNFNKRDSYSERFRNESSDFKSRQNLGNSPHAQKFGFKGKDFKGNNKDFNSKEQSINYGRNQGTGESRFNSYEKNDRKPENQFNKNKKWNTVVRNDRKPENQFNKNRKWNTVDRNDRKPENQFNINRKWNTVDSYDRKPENQFNKNKKWNTVDRNDRTERKPFEKPSGKTFGKTMANNRNRNDYSSNKRESFNKSGGKNDERPLHPSWEAKRKLKTPVNAKFQGKRVVFND